MSKQIKYLSFFIITLFILSVLLFVYFLNPKIFFKHDLEKMNQTDFEYKHLDTQMEIIKFIKNLDYLPRVSQSMERRGDINSTQHYVIYDTYEDASEHLVNYDRTKNESELYISLFYAQLALAYKQSFIFLNCADNISTLITKYKPPFFELSYSDFQKVEEIELDKQNIKGYLERVSDTRFIGQNDMIVDFAEQSLNFNIRFQKISNCDYYLSQYLIKDYSQQRYFFFLKWGILILFTLIAFMIGKTVTLRKLFGPLKKLDISVQTLTSIWSPKEVRKETILAILSVNAVTSTIIAFLAFVIQISGANWFIISLILISIFSLLASILLGIISLNNDQEKTKLNCYRLFILGLAMFVVFFLSALLTGAFSTLFKGVSDSIKAVFTNSTNKV